MRKAVTAGYRCALRVAAGVLAADLVWATAAAADSSSAPHAPTARLRVRPLCGRHFLPCESGLNVTLWLGSVSELRVRFSTGDPSSFATLVVLEVASTV
jgi:hypothetical protein